MKKRLAAVALLCAVMPLIFCSCEGINYELQSLLLIEAVGIDKQDDNYICTLQVLDTDTMMPLESGAETVTRIYSCRGASIGGAIKELTRQTGKKTTLSQNRVIIFGNDVLKEGIDSLLDYFTREYSSRANVFVAAAKGKAEEIVSAEFGEGMLGAEIIDNIIAAENKDAFVLSVRSYELINMLNDKYSGAVIPLLELSEKINDEARLRCSGSVLLDDKGKSAGELTTDDTFGALFINDKVKNTPMDFICSDNSNVGLVITKSDTEISVRVNNGAPEYNIDVDCSADIVEYSKSGKPYIDTEEISRVEKSASDIIKLRISGALSNSVGKYGCDIFHLAKRLELHDPKYFRNNIITPGVNDDDAQQYRRWIDRLRSDDVKITVSARVQIKSLGQGNIKSK